MDSTNNYNVKTINNKENLLVQIEELRLSAISSLEELYQLIKKNDSTSREIFYSADNVTDDLKLAIEILNR